ncbi:MAG: hypothetical protein J4F41_06840 [Alphaproteobacteria bacterium]|nr:hypothetical protein [Alphaproteobacteria bacterium]
MTDTSPPEAPLAGAHCPSCQATCVYEVPLELLAQGITSVDIACHSCGTSFATQLPELALSAPPQSSTEDTLSDDKLTEMSAAERKLRALEMKEAGSIDPPAAPKRRLGRVLGLGLLGGAVIIGTGIVLTPPVDRTPMTATMVQLPITESPGDATKAADVKTPPPEPASSGPVATEPASSGPVATEPVATEPVASGPARFTVADRRFTLSSTELGQVMNISITITNSGGEAGRPATIKLHLVSGEGAILMAWPLAPGRADIPSGQTRQYSTQLIEPPEGVSSVEVEIN